MKQEENVQIEQNLADYEIAVSRGKGGFTVVSLILIGIVGVVYINMRNMARVRQQAHQETLCAEQSLRAVATQLEQHIGLINEQRVELEMQKHELEVANARLDLLAATDGLTGLTNHRAFQDRLKKEVALVARCHTELSILLLDVDKFKSYNDTFGHPSGDAVLRKVAEVLKQTARQTDVVARYGGEEFVVILKETTREDAQTAAERFRRAIETTGWQERPITISVGVATLEATTADAAVLIEQADKALYHSKRAGRNCATHFDSTIDTVKQ